MEVNPNPLKHLLVALLLAGGTAPGRLLAQDTGGLPVRSLDDPTKARALRVAWRVVESLKSRDASRLALVTHPLKGVRFHASIDAPRGQTLRLSRRQMRDFYVSTDVHRWGRADASGEPIDLRAREFARRYLFTRDFTRADSVTFNPQRGPGTAVSNLGQIHPRALRLAFFVEASDGRMDWQQLIVILERFRARWCLVGLAHNEWTI